MQLFGRVLSDSRTVRTDKKNKCSISDTSTSACTGSGTVLLSKRRQLKFSFAAAPPSAIRRVYSERLDTVKHLGRVR